jgi:drug/metabolite transporter (DMT)-like permease
MVAFAANSLLCRAALSDAAIDANSFTLIRLVSGAISLMLLSMLGSSQRVNSFSFLKPNKENLILGGSLFCYALLFSYAYIDLATGTGALLLFGAVQLTILGVGLIKGVQFSRFEVLGVLISLIGFTFLLLPSAEQPPLKAAILMIIAGVSWAIFTLKGKQSVSAQNAVTQGFVYASLLSLPLILVTLSNHQIEGIGTLLAVISGAITSGIGYYFWYKILPKLTLTQISVSQLSVPAIAMVMGSLILSESVTIRTISLSALILFGIALTFSKTKKPSIKDN